MESEEELRNNFIGTGFGSFKDIQAGPDEDINTVSLEN